MSTRYRLSVTDTLNAISAYALSNVVRKVSPPTAPVVTAPKAASQTYAATPCFLITTGTRLGGGTQKVCVKIGTADWEDSVANPERFSTSGALANGVPTIYTPVSLAPGNCTVTFRSVDSGSEAVSPEVIRSFTVLASPFEEIIADVTKVKAAHMRGLRTAVNNVRNFYAYSAFHPRKIHTFQSPAAIIQNKHHIDKENLRQFISVNLNYIFHLLYTKRERR